MSSRRPVSPRAGRGRRHGAEQAPGSPSRMSSAGSGRPGAAAGRTAGSGTPRTRQGASRPGAAAPTAGRTPGDDGPRPDGHRRHVLRWGARRGTETPPPAISVRAIGLLLVALVAFVVLAPTLRYAVTQREDLRTLNAEVAAAQERTAQLEEELERWQDPAYVQAQARDRLGYVVPGETPYVVIDPETVVGHDAERARQEAERARPDTLTPWYL
ncbi:septum formation initiator family protein, partial [Georgenia sp. 10Sc9-8]|nr:septum formation initiator family protein [Georgenia halotolerans]